MLILLSSSARRRYRDDVIRALAHPKGTELRFRYGSEYVEASVLADLKENRLTGTEALICHLADLPDGQPAQLIPCRFATIARAQLVGTSVILTLTADAYVQDLDDASLRAVMKPDELAQLPAQSSDDKTPPGKFAVPITAPLALNAAPQAIEAASFETTAEALRAAGFGSADKPMTFYAVRDLVEIVGEIDQPDRVIMVKDGQYRLKSGKRYALEVYSYSPAGDTNPSDASTLTIESDDTELNFSSEKAAKLDSRYDLNRFRFSTDERLLALTTGLRLSLGVPFGPSDKAVEQRCDITLELRFAGSKWLAAARIAMIAIGTTGPAIIGAYAAQRGSIGLAAVMLIPAIATGIATVFPSLKRS